MKNPIVWFAAFLVLLTSATAQALEVDRKVQPRVTVGGRVITTLDSDEEINLSDSSVALRLDKRLYEGGVAGAVLGITERDGAVDFNQLHVFFWNRALGVKAGRTRLPNTLIEFPILRDDDLLSVTHVGNASSDDEYDQIYGRVASLDWYVDRKNQTASFWAGTRRNGTSFVNAVDGIDSYGIGYRYRRPEPYQYLERIRQAGVMVDAQRDSQGSNPWMQAVIAGTEFNLNLDPRKNWSMGVQGIVGNGVTGVADLNTASNRVRAKSNAVVVGLRYTRRPLLLTRWQIGLTVGMKQYPDFSNTDETHIAASYVYRMGSGLDLLAQASRRQIGSGIVDPAYKSESRVQIGLAMNLEATYNDHIGERTSILNLEHGYIE
jgi:hypothetical protein